MGSEMCIRDRPGTITRDNHRVMNVYRSCKEARSILLELPNIFVISNGLPQDICFYRKDNVWFATVTHENMAYMENPSSKDMEFLKQSNISFS